MAGGIAGRAPLGARFVKGQRERLLAREFMIRVIVPTTLMPQARVQDVIAALGHGTGPMLRSGSPDLARQELAAWSAGTGMKRGVFPRCRARRRAREEGEEVQAPGAAP